MAYTDSNLYQIDSTLRCWTDCPDERMTARCIRASWLLLKNGGEQVGDGTGETVQTDCEIGPVRFLGEILCGSSIDPSSLE